MTWQLVGFRKVASRSLLSLVLVLVGASLSLAQNPPGGGAGGNPTSPGRSGGVSHTIRGKIFLPSGNLPDQRVRVVLELNTGGIVGEVFSDSVGNFEFRSLPNGNYKITIPSDGRNYETAQETVELYGTFARTFNAQVYLKEKGEGFSYQPKDKIISVADLQEVPKEARKVYDRGVKRARENKPEEAAKLFEDALKLFPAYLFAINKLGEQYRALNRLVEARSTFEKAIALNAKFALPHINLGMMMVEQKHYDDAITALETGNRLDDTYPMAHLNLGLALMMKSQPDLERAEKELMRALDLGKRDFVYVRKYLFNLNLRRQRIDKAAAQLEAYLKEYPDAPDADAVRQMLGKAKKMLAEQKTTTKN